MRPECGEAREDGQRAFTVAIAGGGASGTLAAAMLRKRAAETSIVTIDPAEHLGRGVAYATQCPRHLLNVPAGKMSALPWEPDHFVRWLATNVEAPHGPESFVPRSLYGAYLGEIARASQAAAPHRWRHEKALALEVREQRDGIRVLCSNGNEVDADALVIASGNATPAAWPNVSPEVRRLPYFDSAWDEDAIVPGSPGESVVILGTGLTALDAVFGLRYHGHRGTISMVSRRGLLPHEHRVFDAPPSRVPEAKTVSEVFDAVRTLNWRGVIDDVRPHTNALWTALSLEEQRRFFRHALPYWNVHRHRIAPEAARDFADLVASGSIRVMAGRTGDITANGGLLRVPITLRGSADGITVDAARVINCSGPQHDFRKLENPLIRHMLAHGTMVPNPLGIGVRVAENGALIDADGVASSRLFAIGPARFGTLIETTAIPEIREQAHGLAESLSASYDEAASCRRARY